MSDNYESIVERLNIELGIKLWVYTWGCPVQVIGYVDSHALYFRWRSELWTCAIGINELAGDTGLNDIYVTKDTAMSFWQGSSEWLNDYELKHILVSCITDYRSKIKQKQDTKSYER